MIKEQENIPGDVLNEREFELINIIGEKLGANQRDLSKLMDLSLGMTNMLIRRLIAKGHIRINQLNKRKVEYMLTPKGFAEKTRKSIMYTLKTINSIGLIRNRIQAVIGRLYELGGRCFYLLGSSDLVTLIEMVFREKHWTDCTLLRIKELPSGKLDGIVLICIEDIVLDDIRADKAVNMIEELSKDQDLLKLK